MSERVRRAPGRLRIGVVAARRRFAGWPRAAQLAFAGSFLAGCLGLAFFAGFEVGLREVFPYRYLYSADRRITNAVKSFVPPQPLAPRTYTTHTLLLDSAVAQVDFGRDPFTHPMLANGGGLTAMGPDMLLLPYSGEIHAARNADGVRKTGVAGPDIGREAYHARAEDPNYSDFSIHPDYLRYNDLLHVETPEGAALLASYTEFHPARDCYTNTVARLDMPFGAETIADVSAEPDDWKVIFRAEPCLRFKRRYMALEGHMAGGRMTFAPPSTIYLASGDYHLDGMRAPGAPIAQDPTAQYGKILAIDLWKGGGEIVSSGHRNPAGIDRTDSGALFVVEHGPRGGDELNRIREGRNYGWPIASYGTLYSGGPLAGAEAEFTRHDGFAPPAFAWVPSVATSGLEYLDGVHPHWNGDFLVGSLIDKSLYRIRLHDDEPVYAERIEIGRRIRDIEEMGDGRIVLWTDQSELVFLTPRARPNLETSLDHFVNERDLSDATATAFREAISDCARCHSFAAGDHDKAPSLARIYGDALAATPFEGYSNALASAGGEWTEERLRKFILEPNAVASGTSMPAPKVDQSETAELIVDYLMKIDREI